MLEFEWDEANSAHIAEHDVSCDEAEQVIINRPIDIEYQRRNGEEVLLQIGETDVGRILMIATVVRQSKIGVATAFEASKTIKRKYIVMRGGFHAGGV